jgi:ribosomal protein L12E/L44/L45/RPP1/RPP2
MTETPKSEIVRDWIGKQLDSGRDFTSKDSRRQAFDDFVSENKSRGFSDASRSLFFTILPKTMTDKNLDPAIYGLKRSKKSMSSGAKQDMKIKLHPMPKPSQKTEQESTEETKEETTKEELEEDIDLTAETVALTCKFAFNIIRAKYKKWQPLTQEEQTALGQAWLPIFKKYLAKNWLLWGLPLTVTLSILTTRIMDKKQDGDYQEKTTEEEEEHANEVLDEKNKGEPEKSGWLTEL